MPMRFVAPVQASCRVLGGGTRLGKSRATTLASLAGRLVLAGGLACGLGTRLGAGSASAAQPEPDESASPPPRESRIEPATGRQLAWWTRGPQCDFVHMTLELTIPDMEVPHLDAQQTLLIRGLAMPRESLTLDCIGLRVSSVTVDGHAARFESTNRNLTIHIPGEPLNQGDERTIRIAYSADYPIHDGLGLNWTLGDPGADPETDRFGQIHTQGEAENNCKWFPCHDAPNDRMSTELIVRVPEGFTVLSNGRLESRGALDSDLVTWHYVQDRPHPAYLVSLVVGVFDQVTLAGPGIEGPTQIPMTVYGPVGTAETMERVFAGTPDMLAFFEDWIDEEYPWERYDQVCVRDFHSGGMENTSATTLYEDAARSNREREEDLISHELAHMWFGDLLTCRTWDHLWLNEGWATYGEVLWREERARREAAADGLDPDAVQAEGRRGMLEYMLGLVRVQRRFNRARAPMDPALVSNMYADPELVFERADDAYNKGGAVLHMLRMMLGDELFQRGTRLYVDQFKDGLVETADFQRCMEQVSGQSLEQFFTQWVERPGMPRLDVALDWDESAGELVVTVAQKQRIDADNPAYAFDLPIEVRSDLGTQTLIVSVNTRSTSLRLGLEARPEQVAVDPNLSVFAATHVEKDLTWWRREAVDGVTIVARLDAVEALAEAGAAGTQDLLILARLAGDERQPAILRQAASQGMIALVARGITGDLLSMAWTPRHLDTENPS